MPYEYITTPEHARQVLQEALDTGDVHRRRQQATRSAFAPWMPDRDQALDYVYLYSVLELAQGTRWKRSRHVPGYVARRLKEVARLSFAVMPEAACYDAEYSIYYHLTNGYDPKAQVKMIGEDIAEHYLRLVAGRLEARSAALV